MRPAVAVMDNVSDVMILTRLLMRFDKSFTADEVVLFEDLLEGDFKTFVTREGETTPDGCHILDAFSHFSFHASGQKLVICGLKGVETEDEQDNFKLSKPVVHSTDGHFGDSDKSVIGIRDFFRHHVCSPLCKDLVKPDSGDIPDVCTRPPTAPCMCHEENTYSKAAEAGELLNDQPVHCENEPVQFHSEPEHKLPGYTPDDPNGPPPYEAGD